MNLQTFVDQIKRDCRVGTTGNNADQVASDIIAKTNRVMFRMWRKWNWDWSIEELLFTLPNGDGNHTFGATVGGLIDLGVQGEIDYLRKFTFKRWREWIKRKNIDTEKGAVIGYLRKGRDAAKNIKVQFVHTPSTDTVIEGHAKIRIVPFTTANISAATEFPYFPEESQDVIFEFVKGLTWEQMGDDRAAGKLSEAKFELLQLIKDEEADPAEEITSAPPDYMIFVNRNRGRGGSHVA